MFKSHLICATHYHTSINVVNAPLHPRAAPRSIEKCFTCAVQSVYCDDLIFFFILNVAKVSEARKRENEFDANMSSDLKIALTVAAAATAAMITALTHTHTHMYNNSSEMNGTFTRKRHGFKFD